MHQLSPGAVAALRALPLGPRLKEAWGDVMRTLGPQEGAALLGRVDRYFLLTVLLGRKDAWHPWLYERCREVEAEPDGCLDLWAREHYKSTIITYAGCIQEIIRDPEITIGIFSHTNPVARKFLVQIKAELETNQLLKDTYPEIFYQSPQRESPRWSEEKGLVVRRKTNPKESTIEAHGLVDGQPTGAHFALLVYDDVVTAESVTTPEQVSKTTNMHGLSDNLGARGANGLIRKWHIGTRYSFADTYQYLLDGGALKARIYPATDNGTLEGTPVFLSPEAWAAKIAAQPLPILAAQMLQNPAAGSQAMFQPEWLKFSDIRPATLNVYIMCDPASSRRKESDETAIAVVGIDAGRNKWFLDGYCHKMGLQERWRLIRDLRSKWMGTPGVQLVRVGYERYGLLDALEYFAERMEVEGVSFEIVELAWPREGPGSKNDRVQRLEPDFRAGKWYLAAAVKEETKRQAEMRAAGQDFRIFSPIRRRNGDSVAYSLNKILLDQYLTFPFSAKKDLIDALSRIYDMDPRPPVLIDERALEPEAYSDGV